jgi:hypothetical protein
LGFFEFGELIISYEYFKCKYSLNSFIHSTYVGSVPIICQELS